MATPTPLYLSYLAGRDHPLRSRNYLSLTSFSCVFRVGTGICIIDTTADIFQFRNLGKQLKRCFPVSPYAYNPLVTLWHSSSYLQDTLEGQFEWDLWNYLRSAYKNIRGGQWSGVSRGPLAWGMYIHTYALLALEDPPEETPAKRLSRTQHIADAACCTCVECMQRAA